jgi:3,4-dihydroxy 2-butanone 4-phosphate synthase/GTP cyclohydrolase II
VFDRRGSSAVEAAIEAVATGGMAVVIDDPDRENEGDLVMAARYATLEAVNFMATHARGLICVPMLRDRLDELGIPPMVRRVSDPRGTAFHVSVDLRGQATGISAGERAETIRALADPASIAADFTRPGHVFPLAYRAGGVLERPGHTEASIDLAVLADAGPSAVVCEIAAEDGEMMARPELIHFAERHGLPLVTVGELVGHLARVRRVVRRVSQAEVPLAKGTFTLVGYLDAVDGREHIAAAYGEVRGRRGVLVRLHSECLTGDVFGSRRCDCGEQLEAALHAIVAEGAGVVVYLRGHEGRGIGLLEKLKAYALQDQGLDTVDANLALGHPADARDYAIGVQILADLGVDNLRLMTNNPAKRRAIEGLGVRVLEAVPLTTEPTIENVQYLRAKNARMGHVLDFRAAEAASGSSG